MPKPKKAHQTSFETPSDVFSAVAGVKHEAAEETVVPEVKAEIIAEQTEPIAEQTPVAEEIPTIEPVAEQPAEPVAAPAPAPAKVMPDVAKIVKASDGQQTALLYSGKVRIIPAEPASVAKAWNEVKAAGFTATEFSAEMHIILGCPVVKTYKGKDLEFSASMGIKEKIPGTEYVELK